MVGQFFTLSLLAAAAAPTPATGCPSPDAVAAELERLGTVAAVAAVGTPEIRVEGAKIRVALRGLDGVVSGVREVAAPASCAERASVAAVLVSAWVGAWRTGSFPEAARPPAARAEGNSVESLAPPTAPRPVPGRGNAALPARATAAIPASPRSSASASAAAPPPATRTAPVRTSPPGPARAPDAAAARVAPASRSPSRLLVELGGFGFGIHDGNAGTFGGGVEAGLRFKRWLGIDAVLAGSGERERAMVRGQAAYRLVSLGLGLDLRTQVGPVFGDLGLLPAVTLLTVDGRNLNPGRSVTRWGAAADARVRLGLVLGRFRPFAFTGTSYALRAERLTLDDYPGQSTTLSRWNFSYGLGLAYVFGAVTQGETNLRQPSLGLVE